MHHHLAACQRCPPAHPLDLQAEILKAHRVIAWFTLRSNCSEKNPFQVTTPAGHKGDSPAAWARPENSG